MQELFGLQAAKNAQSSNVAATTWSMDDATGRVVHTISKQLITTPRRPLGAFKMIVTEQQTVNVKRRSECPWNGTISVIAQHNYYLHVVNGHL